MALIQTWLGGKSGKMNIDRCSCEICLNEYDQRSCDTKFRRNGKIANGRDLCKDCAISENKKLIAENGTKALSKLSNEARKTNAKIGGDASAKSTKPNSSKFSTERWNAKTDEEKLLQVTRANNGLQEKLKDQIYATQHFAKVFAQTKIGYMSKAHKDLHEFIKDLGFESHIQIGQMQVDECNEVLKIIVEYNGDMWHCNPRKYKAEDYNSAIRMTAGDKWQKDIARHKMLEKLGYRTIIVWESGWIEDAQKQLDKIKEIYNEISEQKRNSN